MSLPYQPAPPPPFFFHPSCWLFHVRITRRIPFFEQYRRWKSFTVWKRAIKAFKFAEASAALNTGLFSFVTPLRLAIAEIRRQCVEVETRRLFAVGRGETITLQAFLERQRTTQQDVAQVWGSPVDR